MQKICVHCQSSFETPDQRVKYCSRDCYQEATGRPDAHDRNCVICGKSYTAYDHKAKYCSQSCYNKRRAIEPRACPTCGTVHTPGRSKTLYCCLRCAKLKLSNVECSYCGKTFHPRTVKKSKFCSPNCYHASMVSIYPRSRLNFTAKEKRIILERDGYQCVSCGATDNLEFDHILAVCNGGIRSIENGQTLCVSCHDAKTRLDKEIARTRLDLA